MYNAARLLLTGQNSGSVYGCWIADYDGKRTDAYHVVKVHEPNDRLATSASAILTSHRDLRDIAASAWIRGWAKTDQEALSFVNQAVAFHSYWLAHGALDVAYDSLRHAPLEVIRKIAAHIGLSAIDPATVLAQIEALPATPPDKQRYDPTTLLHEKHKMNGGRGYFSKVLSPKLIAKLETEFGPWLRMHGYVT